MEISAVVVKIPMFCRGVPCGRPHDHEWVPPRGTPTVRANLQRPDLHVRIDLRLVINGRQLKAKETIKIIAITS